MLTIRQSNVQALLRGTDSPTPRYHLHCHGCGKIWDIPREYHVTKAIAWAHQQQMAGVNGPHIVEFVHVSRTPPSPQPQN